MHDEAAFLAAIEAEPDNRALRLVYADWLEEQGDARAELLRVLHDLSEAPPTSARYRNSRDRRDRLLGGCDPDWLKLALRPTLGQIREKLKRLDGLDTGRKIFASHSHNYKLNPPLALDRLERVERRIGCRLPDQYRRFVSEFADGGAGPYYGIRPLADLLDKPQSEEWVASLSRPFPSPTTSEDALNIDYSPPGALPICEFGCGSTFFLILAGPDRGRVWFFSSDGLGWFPEFIPHAISLPVFSQSESNARLDAMLRMPPTLRADFLDWYGMWLDESLWTAGMKAAPAVELFDRSSETSSLSVVERDLESVPNSLRRLTGLKSLDLHNNKLTSLPKWIGELTNLEFLGIGANPLAELPNSIGKLIRLKRLFCSSTNSLTRLPKDIGNLVELESLRLGFNLLEEIPASIGNLVRLRELSLEHNQLCLLPDGIGRLTRLRELQLTWNQLTDLPVGLANLAELQTLDLRSNQFRSLPDCVGRLPALTQLQIGENPKLDVADACRKLAQLPTLRYLSLFRLGLTELPEEIGLLTQLTSLYLSWNQLRSLPASIGRLTNLERIDLDHNADVSNLLADQRRLLPYLG